MPIRLKVAHNTDTACSQEIRVSPRKSESPQACAGGQPRSKTHRRRWQHEWNGACDFRQTMNLRAESTFKICENWLSKWKQRFSRNAHISAEKWISTGLCGVATTIKIAPSQMTKWTEWTKWFQADYEPERWDNILNSWKLAFKMETTFLKKHSYFRGKVSLHGLVGVYNNKYLYIYVYNIYIYIFLSHFIH